MVTDTPVAPVADGAQPADQPTLTSVLAANADEIGDDVEQLELDQIEAAERGKVLAFADRLLRRLAEDEAQITAVAAAAKAEVELITARWEATARSIQKRASWKRFVLEGLARILFPDAKVKSKSINLPYGTLGRRDFQPVPKLVDEEAAVARCLEVNSLELVRMQLTMTAQDFEDFLVSVIQRYQKQSSKLTMTQVARKEIDALVEQEKGRGGRMLKLSLLWGELKKQPAVALWAADRGGRGGGVTIEEQAPDFYAKLTEG